jgi:hypothetical protein
VFYEADGFESTVTSAPNWIWENFRVYELRTFTHSAMQRGWLIPPAREKSAAHGQSVELSTIAAQRTSIKVFMHAHGRPLLASLIT